jgi:hypothetical protein
MPRVSEIHWTVELPEVRRWGEVEVETFMPRQSCVYDSTRYEIEAPTTMIWRREGETWKLALEQSIPLVPAPPSPPHEQGRCSRPGRDCVEA